MIRAALVIAASCAAAPLSALSCREPDPVRAFLAAQAAPETYRVLVGTLSYDTRPFGPSYQQTPPARPVTVEARFSGQALGLNGLVPISDQSVRLVQDCAGPWCGQITGSGPFLIFVKQTATGHEVAIDPCGSCVFFDPTPQTIETLTTCLQGGSCQTAERRGN